MIMKDNKAMMLILLLPQNNLFLLCTEANGSNKLIFQSSTEVSPHVSERKLVPMVKTTGVSSESINSKKLNSSFSVDLKIHGRFLKI